MQDQDATDNLKGVCVCVYVRDTISVRLAIGDASVESPASSVSVRLFNARAEAGLGGDYTGIG